MQKILNNVVKKEKLREIQSSVLNELSDILKLSFGPNGSNACIKKENALSRYSKDGHTIISALHYNGIIEQSIKDDVESITRHIVKTVGDGTTSAVILSAIIFNNIKEFEKEYSSADIINTIENFCKYTNEYIKRSATELTIDDVYNIAMISTNGNEFVSEQIRDIYDEFGTGVYIDVSPSIGEDFVVKSYNGMTLNTGYSNSCYVTNQKNNTSEVDNPELYFFEHPIDTKELGVYLDAILSRNIIEPVNNNKYDELVPTVIFAPKISQDMSSLMDSMTAVMAQMPVNNRLPICIITDFHEKEQLIDLSKMCGAKLIRKYIDKAVYENDVKKGAAPTPETIFNWAGKCDRVISYTDKTTFIRPSKMYNEDGSYSDLYDNLCNFLETEIKNLKNEGEDIRTIGTFKRRLHSLKSNMVEFLVGGITQADRDSLRDLVEDAVLNIRSAAQNGVGYGANISALMAVDKAAADYIDLCKNDLVQGVANSINDAYETLVDSLYVDTDVNIKEIKENAAKGLIYNIREMKWTDNVKTSIMSDVTILDTVTKIISIMATCNQFLVPTAMHNIYVDVD